LISTNERGPTILKLGGSVVTDKGEDFSPRLALIEEIAAIISRSGKRFILVHGGGSFAHPIAARYGLEKGYRDPSQLIGLAKTKQGLVRLQALILEALIREGIPAVAFMASSFARSESGRIRSLFLEPMRSLFAIGVTPLVSGDIVADSVLGFSVVSGDQLASALAIEFGAGKVIFGSDVNGVYTEDPKRDAKAQLIRTVDMSTIDGLASTAGSSAQRT